MSSLPARFSAAALAFSLTACVSFTNGIADKPTAPDGRLIGDWVVADNGAPGGFLSITADGSTGLTLTLYDDSSCKKDEQFTAVRTRIGQRDFLDLTSGESDPALRKHAPLAYEFQGPDRLAAFAADEDVFAQAVNAKELPGTVTTFRETNLPTLVEVTASTAELRQWIAAHPAATHGKPAMLVRRDPASAPHCG